MVDTLETDTYSILVQGEPNNLMLHQPGLVKNSRLHPKVVGGNELTSRTPHQNEPKTATGAYVSNRFHKGYNFV